MQVLGIRARKAVYELQNVNFRDVVSIPESIYIYSIADPILTIKQRMDEVMLVHIRNMKEILLLALFEQMFMNRTFRLPFENLLDTPNVFGDVF